jgi:hypothetical protein
VAKGKKDPKADGMIPSDTACKLLMLSDERLRQLAADGWFPRAVRGQYGDDHRIGYYDLGKTVQGYIKFLKDEEKNATNVKAESALKAARQREVELRIAEREGAVVDMEDVQAFFAWSDTMLRAELEGVPASVTRDISEREAIGQAIDGAISRAHRRFVEAAEALRAGRDPLGTSSEDDT